MNTDSPEKKEEYAKEQGMSDKDAKKISKEKGDNK
jgi:hypothetical protein